ncbi:hypothetical protein BC937DRAFT_94139 [Endogone sp. FLAS-F59071]|nr:hypothetical protein BC937DRAFT_94139 [Endogone sp. FLAS-F59071]|eukprot:RUS20884.1 hypothetical protein BC937DRAFT_94139 [Endogone sp. FLAS-F59071]
MSSSIDDSQGSTSKSLELARPLRKEITFSEDEDEEIVQRGYDSGDAEDEEEGLNTPEAADLLQNEKAIKSGYLLKKGIKRREYQLLRFIDLHDVHTVTEVKLKNKSNVFSIVTPQRTFYVQADSRRLLDEWVGTIERARRDLAHADDDVSSVAMDEEVAKEVVSSYAHEAARRASVTTGQVGKPARQSVRVATGGPKPQGQGYEPVSPKSPSGITGSPTTASAAAAAAAAAAAIATNMQPVSILKNPSLPPPTLPSTQNPLQISTSNLTTPPTENPYSISIPPINIPPGGSHVDYFVSSNPATQSQSYTSNVSAPTSPLSGITESAGFLSSEGAASSEDEWDVPRVETEAEMVVEEEEDKNRVLFQGYLLKLGRNKSLQSWKKRWFVLRSDSLSYYKNEKEYAVNKVIPLSQIVDSLEIEPVSRNKLYCFKIVIPKRNYIICADTEADLEGWLDALSVAVRRAKKSEEVVEVTEVVEEPEQAEEETIREQGRQDGPTRKSEEMGPAIVRSQA